MKGQGTMMNRFSYTGASLLLGALAMTGCPGDDVPSVDTDTDTDTNGTTGGTTLPPDTTSATEQLDSSSGGMMCMPECPEGECCIGGVCFNAPEPDCGGACGPTETCVCPDLCNQDEEMCSCEGCGVEGDSYDPCFGVECPAGEACIVDDPADPSFAVCAQQGCGTDSCVCPLPSEGTASNTCGEIPGDEGGGSCYLDCSDGASCPTGMECRNNEGTNMCVWPAVEGYGDCIDNPVITCGRAEELCFVDDPMLPGAGACSSACADASECLQPPPTGDAVVSCGDFGGGNTCYLDCSGGETCPNGMGCTDVGGSMACLWPDEGFQLDEDFEQGYLRPGWSLLNEDGFTPNRNVAFVSDAWVVTDEVGPAGNFSACSTSWYEPVNQADDWIITPQVMLDADDLLAWDAQSIDGAFPDGYEVYISTAGPTIGDFMANAPLFTIANEATTFTPHQVDLAAAGYADQAVHFAFRNNSNDQFLLLIDNIRVGNVPPPPSLGYGDCIDNPVITCEAGEDTCLLDDPMMPGAGACSQSGCADATECLTAPATGDAVVTCGDLGAGNTCYLDCAGGETCPDGMTCTAAGADMICLWQDQGFVLNEDFESGAFAAGWTLIDVDMNPPNAGVAYVVDAWVIADDGMGSAAVSTSWYDPPGQADDWMVTPMISLGAASVLSWEAQTPDPMFPDGYEVYVSTTGPTVMDFIDPPVFTIAAEADMYTPHMVDLAMAGYASTDVWIAFRNNSTDQFILQVNNIQVTQ